jgi:diadenylate cyclase
VIIHDNRIQTAGCLLPLTKNPYINKRYGTRHRAAIGLSEETDAVIVVISEETQEISLVQHGSITNISDETVLLTTLEELFMPKDHQPHLWKNWFAK